MIAKVVQNGSREGNWETPILDLRMGSIGDELPWGGIGLDHPI